MRHLILVLGDQLDARALAWQGFDPAQDQVLMIEAASEASVVWSHRQRIAVFLSAMRHFAIMLNECGRTVQYVRLREARERSLFEVLTDRLRAAKPQRLIAVWPGEWRVKRGIEEVAAATGVSLEWREDAHFHVTPAQFARWASGYKELRMEFFYRAQRKRWNVLMQGDDPEGLRWNFDSDNRSAFGRDGPRSVRPPGRFTPDAITADVIAEVAARFPDHPGSLDSFAWPVTRADALRALQDFIEHRLPHFGEHQDAMWTGEPWLDHSLLSVPLNLKLLDPREVIAAATDAYARGDAPLASVEGFVRQVLGWREFIRGVYWLDMPAMREANTFGHQRPLPDWYWTGRTHMNCLAQVIGQTLEYGFAHHIQRLMITGMFGVLAELSPLAVADWYLAVYVDAVEWVELPNVIGMALYANDGRFTSKPYVASGAYVQRMSNYCAGCRYDPKRKAGPKACPMTVLYWRFLDRHEARFAEHPRTALMVRNLQRLSAEERAAIRAHGDGLLANLEAL
jgi:deoxyribodipyrimidine photolyase-related protein